MSEPVTQAQFFTAMEQFRELIDTKHSSMRQYVGERCDRIEQTLKDHADDDRLIADRVLIIETERKEQARQELKRSAFTSLVVATGLTGVVELGKKMFR